VIIVYVITLVASSGLTGLFARQAFGEQGYVPGLTAGLMLAGGMAAAYAGVQMLYLAIVRSVWPTKTNTPLLVESISHGATLIFVPYLMRMDIPWPHPAIKPLEGAVFAAAFLGSHGFLKLIAFYAILRSAPGARAWNLVWAAVSAVCILAGFSMFSVWLGSIEKARPRAPEAVNTYRIGTTYANARAMPEGSVLTTDVSAPLAHSLSFACAIPEDDSEEIPLEVAYVTVEMRGDTTTKYTGPVELQPGSWSYFRVPADQLPRNLQTCLVRWSSEQEAKWRTAIGVLPILSSNRTLLMVGPEAQETRTAESTPNILYIVIDGLGADRVSGLGYSRATTPNIDRLGRASQLFPLAFTPSPDPAAACMTLLTGVSPLRHGFLGKQKGPLASEYTTLTQALRAKKYATAAFTEGEMWGDLTYGSAFERGFDFFDDGYLAESTGESAILSSTDATTGTPSGLPPAGSQLTIRKAAAWVKSHQNEKFMLFVRLGELRDVKVRERYGTTFIPDPATATPSMTYDAAINYLDKSISELLAALPPGRNNCIVITSTRAAYAIETPPLSDWNLRVPLVLHVPGGQGTKRDELIALEDVPPTLAKIAGVTLSPYASTADLLGGSVTQEPISMAGDPLQLSIRNARMRLVWSTQRSPFTMVSTGPPAGAALYDLGRIRPGRPIQDIADSNPDIVRRWTEKLEQYFTMQSEAWQTRASGN